MPPNLIGLNGANAQFFTQSDTVKALHFYIDATGIATNLEGQPIWIEGQKKSSLTLLQLLLIHCFVLSYFQKISDYVCGAKEKSPTESQS